MEPEVEVELDAICARFSLDDRARGQLAALTRALAEDPHAPTGLHGVREVVRDHVADALVALDLPEVAGAARMLDIGSGAGLPALPLAIARPRAEVVALDSVARKTAFIARVAAVCGIENVTALPRRAEEFAEGRDRFDLVTARALAPLEVVAEYAAPLLRVGGALVAWRGRRDPESEASAAVAADELGLAAGPIVPVSPYAGAAHRHLHVWLKVTRTPERFPRRPGVARKRPLGHRSDRARR